MDSREDKSVDLCAGDAVVVVPNNNQITQNVLSNLQTQLIVCSFAKFYFYLLFIFFCSFSFEFFQISTDHCAIFFVFCWGFWCVFESTVFMCYFYLILRLNVFCWQKKKRIHFEIIRNSQKMQQPKKQNTTTRPTIQI